MSSLPPETASGHFEALSRERTWTARLTLVHPPEAAAVIALGDGALVLGREASGPGGPAILHRTVSRRHLEIRWDAAAGRHLVRDLGSRNGAALHGQPLAELPRALDDNAVLRIGDVLAVYERSRGPVVDDPSVDRRAIPGAALSVLALRAAIGRAAPDPSPILLLGESGSGKERTTAELHRLSGRRGPLVTLNCAALSAQLIESQLFGHQRGAFTGATAASPGLFRAADGGTLFLDEIGELPLDLQPKLLRAIEQGEVLPLGATAHHRVDVRVIAATHRVLAREVDEGAFRRDLYARLALWELEIPPLCRRRVDILAWLDRLARLWADERGLGDRKGLALAPAAASAILCRRWPDNLRGLHRLVHDLAHLPAGATVEVGDLPTWLMGQDPSVSQEFSAERRPAREPTPPARPAAPAELRPRPTRDELLAALAAHGWNITATARAYDRDRKQVSRWIAMYGIDVPGREADR
ncbi:MAG: sigma 54-interacting transcriptional regulator [Nannocystaceae bacterium]